MLCLFCGIFSPRDFRKRRNKSSLPYFCSSNNRWSPFLNGSNRNHSIIAQHTELLVFHCCSFPSTTLCSHFHNSTSIVSPFQLLLLLCTPSFQSNRPPRTGKQLRRSRTKIFHQSDLFRMKCGSSSNEPYYLSCLTV